MINSRSNESQRSANQPSSFVNGATARRTRQNRHGGFAPLPRHRRVSATMSRRTMRLVCAVFCFAWTGVTVVFNSPPVLARGVFFCLVEFLAITDVPVPRMVLYAKAWFSSAGITAITARNRNLFMTAPCGERHDNRLTRSWLRWFRPKVTDDYSANAEKSNSIASYVFLTLFSAEKCEL